VYLNSDTVLGGYT